MPDQNQSEEARKAIQDAMAEHPTSERPTQLHLFDPDDIDIVSRSERMAQECIEAGEPFFVLRAKDMFSVMAVHNYAKLVEEYGPLDVEFHGAVTDSAQEMREWQQANPQRVKYPD